MLLAVPKAERLPLRLAPLVVILLAAPVITAGGIGDDVGVAALIVYESIKVPVTE